MRLPSLLLLLCVTAADTPVRVRLTSPQGGWTAQRVVPISGSVSDRSLRVIELGVNGRPRKVNVRGGRFDARLPVRPGLNTVEAVAQTSTGQARDRATFFAQVPRTDVQIFLTWDTDGTDLDLRVTAPNGEECYHGHRHTSSGGVLEVDDTDGFGPEIFLLPVAPRGEYQITVAYYDAGRATLTEAEVEVVVREGTAGERRYAFPVTFTQEGETVEVGSFFLGSQRE
jgi:uncharacterized protein YfaP (DUF2135 family)